MFCHQCGKELRENARFCFNCGTPVREAPEPTEAADMSKSDRPTKNAGADIKEPDSQTASAVTDTKESNDQTKNAVSDTDQSDNLTDSTVKDAAVTDTQTENATPGTAKPDTQAETTAADTKETPTPPSASDVETPADLILKKGKVIATGRELHLNGKHYARKPGKKKFKKKRKASPIPFDAILGTSMEHHKYGGRIFLSLLLLVCFAAGTLFSARYGYDTYNELNTPYRDKELAAQESIMAIIDNNGADQLLQYQNSQKENRADAEALSAKLAELEAQQAQEILTAAYTSDKFDLDTFFNKDLFARAYREYLQDLLDAFREDELLDSWLYSYYETTKEYGGNYFLDTDMWIYDGDGENKFSSDLDSADLLMSSQYDLDLYEHILYAGHIYITGADFMKEILSLPRYTVNGAVFVKAYGGVPDPAKMSVPGWSRSHYEEFWLYGDDYYTVNTPLWLDQGLQAESFELDWNTLVNEAAYYDAYKKFMDKIAPGLPCYDMAVYHADDEAYGGMGYVMEGTEASFSDMVAAYADNHPEFVEELTKNYGKTLTTSVDEDIAEAQAQLEKLENELRDLEEQEEELAQLLADADIHRNYYALLTADIEQHRQELTYRLLFFGSGALLCAFIALVCLCKFFGFLRRPRHLFVIRCQDMELAFNTKRCSKEQIAALQNRLQK